MSAGPPHSPQSHCEVVDPNIPIFKGGTVTSGLSDNMNDMEGELAFGRGVVHSRAVMILDTGSGVIITDGSMLSRSQFVYYALDDKSESTKETGSSAMCVL